MNCCGREDLSKQRLVAQEKMSSLALSQHSKREADTVLRYLEEKLIEFYAGFGKATARQIFKMCCPFL